MRRTLAQARRWRWTEWLESIARRCGRSQTVWSAYLDAVTPAFFRAIERTVGTLEHLLGGFLRSEAGNSGRERDLDPGALEVERAALHPGSQAIKQPLAGLERCLGQQQYELLPAESSYDIGFAQPLAQLVGDDLEHSDWAMR